MAAWSDWYPDILPHVPLCPAPVVDHELRRASQIFFEGSRAWKKTLPSISVTAGDESIDIVTGDTQIDIVRVEEAWYDGKKIDVFTPEELAEGYGDDWKLHTGTPIGCVQFEPGVARLYPIPEIDSVSGFKVEASVKPSDAATGVPDNMRTKFKDALAAGAKGRLMLYPKKPWSDPQLGIAYGESFGQSIAKACIESAKSFGKGQIRSRPGWC